jgi:hypothetical protein
MDQTLNIMPKMKIGLIDIDHSNFPNIALMKISAWHKKIGDQVDWYTHFEHYDIVYVAKVFSFTEDWREPINADRVILGGSGYMIRTIDGKEGWYPFQHYKETKRRGYEYMNELPYHIEHIYPDYSLYPMYTKDTAYGFLTRGCPRGCEFCHVAAKEGKPSYKVADLQEFWEGQKNIVLCDPNILACKDWEELLQQLIDSKAWVDFNQGLDIRMMTEEKAQMLSQIKTKQIHFAWDRYQDKELVLPRLEMFAKHTKLNSHNRIVYTLVNFDTTIDQDLERIYTLRKMGYWAYVMVYDKENADPIYKKIARWVNNRYIFAKCERFEDYWNNQNQNTNH